MSVQSCDSRAVLDSFPSFEERVTDPWSQTGDNLGVMQVNVGRRCNLACKHCHVEAGPDRTEAMSRETMQQCLDVFVDRGFQTLDITGGSPEMNPDFEWFIQEAANRNIAMMIRSNLVILEDEPYRHLPELYAQIGAALVASLPHYIPKAMERQRGAATFNPVIAMIKKLNDLGYGKGEGLELDLVYNPAGAFLPPDQAALESEYKQHLMAEYGVVFDNLFAIANNPLGRFGEFLQSSDNLEGYMNKLIGAYNEATLPNMMCRNQMSVGWDGRIYDCDFNQAAGVLLKD
ncbi:MAG: arsenosugar biosynthesis radical SAM protein ArsS, partial [Raoultibacter sp.]